MRKKVFVGMSGGVDSSLSAALLVEQGYDVTGVYMKNWSKDLPGFPCPWKEDYQDAKRVAVALGIPFEVFDFEQDYFEKVVQYMLDGFKAGITPNPDVMCNQEIKFKLFYELARAKGADLIATGHYARAEHRVTSDESRTKSRTGLVLETNSSRLKTAYDSNKDQTYFLYRITSDVLANTIFPLGELTKPQVRAEASKRGLITALKKESMGICFVGKVGIREFLEQYIETEPGAIIDQNGSNIGNHDGAIFYTIGQRHGLDVGGGLPYYVTGKNMKKNEVYVTNDIQDKNLWTDTIKLTSLHWITQQPESAKEYFIRTRHRAPLISCRLSRIDSETAETHIDEKLRAITPGQSAVLYDGETCLGGGIITI